ncbi:MAG: hypothetical protein C0483_21590 [Pirellula sp.]|nr:hypothetical protein [Pirellula sp.]
MARWTRERIIREILRCESEQRKLSSSASGNGVDTKLYQAALRMFGSWRNAVVAAGLPASESRSHREWTASRLLRSIRALSRQPKRLTAEEVRERYGQLVPAARRYFGSWSKALVAAGVTPSRSPNANKWSEAGVMEAILTRAIRNESMEQGAVRPRSLVQASISLFGSWHDAIQLAGIDAADNASTEVFESEVTRPIALVPTVHLSSSEPLNEHRRGTRWSEQEILEALLRRYRSHSSLGVSVVQREHRALYRAARAFYGNWNNALLAAGLVGDGVPKGPIAPANRPQV